jgi:hypothetical protein
MLLSPVPTRPVVPSVVVGTAAKPADPAPNSAAIRKARSDCPKKMGDRRPTEPASLWRSLKSFLGTSATEVVVEAASARLIADSTWADEVRSPSTTAWHYVNFPRDGDCQYEPDRICLHESCVVGAIERQSALLGAWAAEICRDATLERMPASRVHFIGSAASLYHGGAHETLPAPP